MVVDLDQPATQETFGALVGVTQQAVSDMVTQGVLPRGGKLSEWVAAYCARLREQAAGRAANGDLQLASERARLASEQADRIAMINAERRRELAPVAVLEVVLARVGRQIAGILEALPIQIKRHSTAITTEDLQIIEREIVRARNLAANIELKLDEEEDGLVGDPAGDPLRAEAA